MDKSHLLPIGLAAVTFLVTAAPVLLGFVHVEYLLDLDDQENFVTHPLALHAQAAVISSAAAAAATAGPTTLAGAGSAAAAALRLAAAPVLGVVEPVSAVLRVGLLAACGPSAAAMFVAGCALHGANAALLCLFLAELHHALGCGGGGGGCEGGGLDTRRRPLSAFAASAGVLLWALHPLRGEVLGWLSCQSYHFVAAFSLLAARASLRSSVAAVAPRLPAGTGRPGAGAWAAPHAWSLVWFACACGCKAVAVTLPALLVALHAVVGARSRAAAAAAAAASAAAAKAPAGHPTPPSAAAAAAPLPVRWWARALALQGLAAATLRFGAHAAVALAAVAATHAVNAGGGGGAGDAATTVAGVSADAGLFWAPAVVSPTGQAVKASLAALWFYPACLLHPFGLRGLYLTPRSFSGAVVNNEAGDGHDLAKGRGAAELAMRGGERGEGGDVSGAELSPLLVGLGGFAGACVLAAAVAAGGAAWAARGKGRSVNSSSARSPAHEQLPLPLGAALTLLCWAVLLLPGLGLYGGHGWTLLGADRYAHLPTLFVGAPLVAFSVHWGEARLGGVDCGNTYCGGGGVGVGDGSAGGRGSDNDGGSSGPVAREEAISATASGVRRPLRQSRQCRWWRLACWRLCWALLVAVCGLVLASGFAKWRSSDALWPQAALCRAGPGPWVDVATHGPQSGKEDSSSWLHLYACPDVIAVYNLARRLQKVHLSSFSSSFSSSSQLSPVPTTRPPFAYSCPVVCHICLVVRLLSKLRRLLSLAQVDRGAAARAYAAAVGADPRHGGAWNNLGTLVEAGHGDPLADQSLAAALRRLGVRVDEGVKGAVWGASGGKSGDVSDSRSRSGSDGGSGGGSGSGALAVFAAGDASWRRVAAERAFETAAALHPATHASAWNNLGRLLHATAQQQQRQGPSSGISSAGDGGGGGGGGSGGAGGDDVITEWAGAGAAYRSALGVSPGYALAWHNLGLWQLAAPAHIVAADTAASAAAATAASNDAIIASTAIAAPEALDGKAGAEARLLPSLPAGAAPVAAATLAQHPESPAVRSFERAAAAAAAAGAVGQWAESLTRALDLRLGRGTTLIRAAQAMEKAHRTLGLQKHQNQGGAGDAGLLARAAAEELAAAEEGLKLITGTRPHDAHARSMLAFAQQKRGLARGIAA